MRFRERPLVTGANGTLMARRTGITGATRAYITILDEAAASWNPLPEIDNSPLNALLDAVDQHKPVSLRKHQEP